MPRLGGERPGQGGITSVGWLLGRGQGIGHRLSIGGRRGIGLIGCGMGLNRRRLRGCQTHRLISCAREAARGCEPRGAAVLRGRHRRRRVRRFQRRRSGWITVDHRRTGSRRCGLSPTAFGPLVHGSRGVGLARGGRKPPRLSILKIRLRYRKRIICRRWCRVLRDEGDGGLTRRQRHSGLRGGGRFTHACGATDSQRPDQAKPCTGAEDGPQQHRESRVPWRNHEVLSRGAFDFFGGLCGFLHQRVPGG